ncbi:MAG: hypothetical protein HKP59_02040 [Lutibacter sp.]|jgi:hypothetical protein|uniref:hypothetical protein n=1 Tax=Lutibacter sp. TaxID=1925666 RepID=UPI0018561E8F|nr:hypothetical protein [Lutibacter sp.]MBT8316384.1 hypothetical protein [Lutibacter sp.]NNJ57244.1 hypothetical protein [Lutibacter sp.]
MENPFKKILHNEEVPKVLRERVINDISLIKLSIDMADLFVIKYPNTIGEILDTEKKPIKNKKKEN